MSSSSSVCPNRDELLRLVKDEQTDAENHVDHCENCQQAIHSLLDDPTLQAWRQARKQTPQITTEELTQIRDAEAQQSSPPPLPMSLDLEGFQIKKLLGRGGMAVVYLARQLEVNRNVALKMLLPGAELEDRARARLSLEAEHLAQLQHPNIVQLFSLSEHEGQTLLVLEHVPGVTLSTFLTHAHPSPTSIARFLAQVADAVHYAHEQGIIHRDLKPSNILVTPPEADSLDHLTPKISDFGLSRALQDEAHLTQSGVVVGTPAYLAPEVLSTSESDVSPAQDIYALGAILYRMITGRPPFETARVLSTLHQIENAQPIPPGDLCTELPRDLETICLKCLEKEPKHRYSSVQALAEDLRSFAENRPISARPVSRLERFWIVCKRNPLMTLMTTLLMMAITVGSVMSWSLALEAQKQKQLAEQKAQLADDLAYYADLRLAQAAWEDNNIAQLRTLLQDQTPQSDQQQDRRGFEWYYWKHQLKRELAVLRAHSSTVHSVSFRSPSTLVSTGSDGMVYSWHPKKNQTELSQISKKIQQCSVLSEDGSLLAIGKQNGQAQLWKTQPAKRLLEWSASHQPLRRVALHPSGQILATLSVRGEVALWSLTSAQALRVGYYQHPRASCLGFSRDGRMLAVGGWDGKVTLYSLKAKRIRHHWRFPNCSIVSLAFAKDDRALIVGSQTGLVRARHFSGLMQDLVQMGKTPVSALCVAPKSGAVALGTMQGTIAVLNWPFPVLRFQMKGHQRAVLGLRFSPDEKQLASASSDATVRLWNVNDKAGASVIPLRAHGCSAAFHPNGRDLAIGMTDGTVRLIDRMTGSQRKWSVGSTPVRKLALDRLGKRLAAVTSDGVIHLFEVPGGQCERIRLGPLGKRPQLAMTPDGSRLAVSRGNDILIVDLKSRKVIRTLSAPRAGVQSLCFSQTGNRLLSSGKSTSVQMWQIKTGKLLMSLLGQSGFSSVCFGPQDKTVIAGDVNGRVWFWDARTGKKLGKLSAHTKPIYSLDVRADGSRLITSGWDQRARLWDLRRREMLLTLCSSEIRSTFWIGFSPQGDCLAQVGLGGSARFWLAPRE